MNNSLVLLKFLYFILLNILIFSFSVSYNACKFKKQCCFFTLFFSVSHCSDTNVFLEKWKKKTFESVYAALSFGFPFGWRTNVSQQTWKMSCCVAFPEIFSIIEKKTVAVYYLDKRRWTLGNVWVLKSIRSFVLTIADSKTEAS